MSPGEFFNLAVRSFRAAESAHGQYCRDFLVAGFRLRICFAGPDLVEDLTRALDHLRDSAGNTPDLTVLAWASDLPQQMPPALDWGRIRTGAHGALDFLTDGRFAAGWMHEAGGLYVLDSESSQAIYWLRSARHMPYWERGAPMRRLLDGWFAVRGVELVHAAALGNDSGAILLAGPGGSGKSSTALRALGSGLHYLADDYAMVDAGGGHVYSLYSTGKIDAAGLRLLPFLEESVTNPGALETEKALLFVHESFPFKVVAGPLPIRAIVLPTIDTRQQTRLRPASPAAALKALAPSTLLQSAHRYASRLSAMASLVRRYPAFHLVLGEDASRSIDELASLLGSPESSARPLVSVIIPAYNPGPYLHEALASVLAQDAAHRPGEVEVIIVDDGSDEDIPGVVRQFSGRLDIQLVRQERQGPSAARNRGIGKARADRLAFLDADDVWPAGTLTAMLSAIEGDAAADVVHGRLRNLVHSESSGQPRVSFGPPRWSFNVGSMLFRRRAFEQAGLFDERLHFSEDVDLLMRIAHRGLRRIPTNFVTLYYRRHGGGLTGPLKRGERGRVHLQSWARLLKASLDRSRVPATGRERVSVIIAVRNGAKYLAGAIESVLRQTRPADEIIVVDGHSQDDTAGIAAGFPLVTVIQQPATGLADARNAGIAAANGEWIAFLDHDDIWPEQRLELQLEALRCRPDAEYSLGLLEFFSEGGPNQAPDHAPGKFAEPRPGPTPGTLMARKTLFDRLGKFDARYAIGCDLEWIKRVREQGIACAPCASVLLRKRLHGGNLSLQTELNRVEIFRILRATLERNRG